MGVILTPEGSTNTVGWWFRNPKANHRLDVENLVNNGINYLSLNWWVFQILQPSTVWLWGTDSMPISCRILRPPRVRFPRLWCNQLVFQRSLCHCWLHGFRVTGDKCLASDRLWYRISQNATQNEEKNAWQFGNQIEVGHGWPGFPS